MTDVWWKSLGNLLSKRSGAVLIVALIVSIGLAAGSSRLEFATGQDSYLNSDSPIAIDNQEYQSLFGGQSIIVLYTAQPGQNVTSLFTNPANREKLAGFAKQVDAVPGIFSTATPLTAMDWNQALVLPAEANSLPPEAQAAALPSGVAAKILLGAQSREPADSPGATARSADAAKTLQRATAALTRPNAPADAVRGATYDNPDWVEFLMVDNQGNIRQALLPFFPFPPGVAPTLANATHAQTIIRMQGNGSIEQDGNASVAAVDAVNNTKLDGFTSLTTGAPLLLKDINDYLQKGMLVLGAIAIVVMILILSGAFRVRWRLVPLLAMVAGVLWTFGLLGWFNFKLSLVTIAGLPILIGLGVEFAIQVHNRIEEEIIHGHGDRPFAATLMNIGPALLLAAVAGVIACLALEASKVPMIRDFGVLLALGVVFVFVAAIILPVAVLSLREKHKPTTEPHPQPLVEKTMTTLGHTPPAFAVPLAVIALALFVGGLFAEERTPIQTDPEKWVSQSSEVIQNLNQLRTETGASSELGVYIKSPQGPFTDPMGRFVTQFATGEIQRYPQTLQTVSSLATTVYYLMVVPGAGDLYPTGADMQAAYAVAPVDLQKVLVNPDAKATNVVFQTGPSSLEARKEVVLQIRADVKPPDGITATPSGLAVVGVGLLDSLTENRLLLTYIAIVGVALWLLIRFLSLIKAAATIVPVLLAVGLSAVVVRLSGITVSPLTTVSGPLVIAICTEFSALIIFRHMEERYRGLAPREAIDVAAARTGRAFFASSLTTVGGFAVLLFSPLPLLRDFGAIVAITIAIALLSAIVVLPPLLVFIDERGWLRFVPRFIAHDHGPGGDGSATEGPAAGTGTTEPTGDSAGDEVPTPAKS